MASVRFCDKISRWVQPPDAENRMSGGVGEVAGAIPSPRPDPCYLVMRNIASAQNPPNSLDRRRLS